ncbi:MAG: CRISPR-associated protein Cas4 [Eubacteriales bacterium]|nr:CRISPR-associated protein Cas4 [Eubacteriales bacterium]
MTYSEDDFLQLSGIQHFSFCRRQWALIHIEQEWKENLRTIEGSRLHEKAHGEALFEKRGDLLIVRGLPVSSSELGFSGACDVVEFHKDDNGIHLFGRRDSYKPVPVEYKRGEPKKDHSDMLQLCAQAMCLEEMLACSVTGGYLYYGETRHRLELKFNPDLRSEVRSMAAEMHDMFKRLYTPRVRTGVFCRACSLRDLCLPKLCSIRPVAEYIAQNLRGEVN